MNTESHREVRTPHAHLINWILWADTATKFWQRGGQLITTTWSRRPSVYSILKSQSMHALQSLGNIRKCCTSCSYCFAAAWWRLLCWRMLLSARCCELGQSKRAIFPWRPAKSRANVLTRAAMRAAEEVGLKVFSCFSFPANEQVPHASVTGELGFQRPGGITASRRHGALLVSQRALAAVTRSDVLDHFDSVAASQIHLLHPDFLGRATMTFLYKGPPFVVFLRVWESERRTTPRAHTHSHPGRFASGVTFRIDDLYLSMNVTLFCHTRGL